MKNKIILLIILMIMQCPMVFAVQESKVISDSEKQKEFLQNFNEVNQYTNNFFTPIPKEKTLPTNEPYTIKGKNGIPERRTPPPIKRLRLNYVLYKYNKDKNKNLTEEQRQEIKTAQKQLAVESAKPKDQAVLDCDVMEYFAERTELEANGNVVMTFPQNDAVLKTDKLIYNQSSNVINAIGHVVLIRGGQEMTGEYLTVDMNEENALMDDPVTQFGNIHARAKKGYMYGDKIIQEQGGMYVTKKFMVDVKSEMFGPDLDTMFVDKAQKSSIVGKEETHGSKFMIKTRDLIINSKKEHDDIILKSASIYLNEKKLCTIPSFTIHTNKNRDYFEAAFPELGTMTNMGMYAGPGFVFDTPKGSSLKLIPVLNYQSAGDDKDATKFGWGGVAKFKSATNKTDVAYGTTNKTLLIRGIQYLDDNLYLQYGTNSYLDDWFMGFRMPRLMGELVYQDSWLNNNFLGEKKNMIFSHRIAGAYVQDGVGGLNAAKLGEDGIGTMRFKYMAEAAQTLFSYKDWQTSPINARFDIVFQGSAAVYGTGGTQFVGRVGPRIHTQYKRWMQDVGYFASAFDDNSPLVHFDKYYYGRSNVYVRESLRLCKYLTLSWLASLNLSDDAPDKNMMQENSFFLGIGPDDVKLNIGYDIVRQQSFVTMTMHLDAKGSSLQYKKMVIKNPDTFGKTDANIDMNQPAFKIYKDKYKIPNQNEEPVIERAEVVDVISEGRL